MSRLKKKYKKQVVLQLANELGIKNHMAVPKIVKVVVNMGIGETSKNKKILVQARRDLAAISGQAPSVRLAKAAVASFSIRRGMPVGLKVTLRGGRMYDFLDKLFSIVLARLRDFRGVPLSSFDENGNYTLGISEQSVFPEVDIGKSIPRGLEVTIVTSTDDVAKSRKLLEALGMPFEKIKN
jgi:large subunit ribosomal protein L5